MESLYLRIVYAKIRNAGKFFFYEYFFLSAEKIFVGRTFSPKKILETLSMNGPSEEIGCRKTQLSSI